jgi:hypothetical protein
MSVPKGTQPKTRTWIECDYAQFKQSINAMRAAGINAKPDGNLSTEFYYYDDVIIAKHLRHRYDEKYYVHICMEKYVPQKTIINQKESIYEGGSL